MNTYRVEKAVEERAHDWLGVPKGDIYASASELGEHLCIDIRLQSSMGLAPTSGVHQLVAYLDVLTDGRCTISASTAVEIELHPDAIFYQPLLEP